GARTLAFRGADERALLDAGDVVGVGGGPERVRFLLLVELHERARLDELRGQAVPLLVGAVAPDDAVRRGEVRDLTHPGQQLSVRGGRFVDPRHGHRSHIVLAPRRLPRSWKCCAHPTPDWGGCAHGRWNSTVPANADSMHDEWLSAHSQDRSGNRFRRIESAFLPTHCAAGPGGGVAPGGAGTPTRSADTSRPRDQPRSEEHTYELQSRENLVCRLLLENKK